MYISIHTLQSWTSDGTEHAQATPLGFPWQMRDENQHIFAGCHLPCSANGLLDGGQKNTVCTIHGQDFSIFLLYVQCFLSPLPLRIYKCIYYVYVCYCTIYVSPLSTDLKNSKIKKIK